MSLLLLFTGGSPDVTVALTGEESAVSAGSVVPSADLPVSGQQAASAAGDVTTNLSVLPTGQEITGETGTLTYSEQGTDIEVALSGEACVSGIGDVAVAVESTLEGIEVSVEAGDLAAEGEQGLTGRKGRRHRTRTYREPEPVIEVLDVSEIAKEFSEKIVKTGQELARAKLELYRVKTAEASVEALRAAEGRVSDLENELERIREEEELVLVLAMV